MPAFAGLQTNLLTWFILAGMTACWMTSVRFVPGWAREGWPSLPAAPRRPCRLRPRGGGVRVELARELWLRALRGDVRRLGCLHQACDCS